MADTTLDLRAQQFSENVIPLAQQKYSKVLPSVLIKDGVTGKRFSQDQIGTWTMTAKAGLNSVTPQNDPNLTRRWANLTTYHDARILDRSIDLQILADPKSEFTSNAARAYGRFADDIIISAMGGTAATGETGTGSKSFDANMVVAAGGTSLTFAKVNSAAAHLREKDVDMESDLFALISPQGLQGLLGEKEATSTDFAAIKALVKGEISTWMGFNWIVSTRLPKSSTTRDCFFYHKSAIIAGMPEGLFVRAEERADLSYSYQIYYEASIGAVRLEEDKIVKVQITES